MTPADSYPFAAIESGVQEQWDKDNTFAAGESHPGKKFYCLCMFPYPSGRLHMGHMRNYTIGDMLARHQRMLGRNVLQPLGWDAFGLPAENAAIDNGIPPARWTRDNIEEMRAQLKRLGLAIDWRRELATCDADYYQWEQRFFIRLFKQGLIYKKNATVNWDPVDNTVLANEQVVDGRGWRSGAAVQRRKIPMYFMRITQYADELLDELDNLQGWPESVKTMQRNWIGRSAGARVFLPLAGRDDVLECFTTRPDTLFGATFCAIAPEHPLALACAEKDEQLADFIAACRHLGVSEEVLEKTEKRGYDSKLRALHPFDKTRQLPVYVANFILSEYGTGAIYGCPAHDPRDLDFARQKNLPVIPVVLPPGQQAADFAIGDSAYTGDGVMINSDFLNGMETTAAKARATAELEKIGLGQSQQQYRLRDWGVSRQRYWGCPIPIIHCPQCGDVPVAEEDLPVRLPQDAVLDGRGSSLAKMADFVNCACPSCGGEARRETDTLDTFVESSWYFARYASYDCQTAMTDERASYWLPVDHYIGGVEHACLHLLYARFFHKLMRDAGMYPRTKNYNEPFANLLCQGMVLNKAFYQEHNGARVWLAPSAAADKNRTGGAVHYAGRIKMSKSSNNGVDPEQLIAQYGADTARLFILFAAPPEQALDWSDEGVRGCARFLNRLWRAALNMPATKAAIRGSKNTGGATEQSVTTALADANLRIQEFLRKADYDMQRLRFNNIPSAAMNIVNELQTAERMVAAAGIANGGDSKAAIDLLNKGYSIVLRLLAPAVPHITQRLWEELGFDKLPGNPPLIANAAWPQADAGALAARKTLVLAVQVNGKRRGQIEVANDAAAGQIEQAARQLPAVAQNLAGCGTVRKVVIVPGRIVNFVA